MVEFKKFGGWKRLRLAMDGARFAKALSVNIRRATEFNARLVQRAIRQAIRGGAYAPNAKLTAALKGSTKPLVDNADLFNSVTFQVIDDKTAFVGVLRTARDKAGEPVVNLVEVLHEGVIIQVTEKMRVMFAMLSRATKGEDVKLEGRAQELFEQWKSGVEIEPLKPSTAFIVIPPRPFIRRVFEDGKIVQQCRDNWERAVNAALAG